MQTTMTPEEALLQNRRDAAEKYMRSMATFPWRATQDLTWTIKHEITTEEQVAEYALEKQPLAIRAGRLYQGVPYSYSGCSPYTFFKFLKGKDEKGYPAEEGLHWRNLNGGAKSTGRIGNDCSSSVQQSWMFIGANFTPAGTGMMVPPLGYIPVGSYKNDYAQYEDTTRIANENGKDVMFEAYTCLQKADAIVRRADGAGHTMMITAVYVVRDEQGVIDGANSYVTVLHQNTSKLKEEVHEYNKTFGEDVYFTFGIDDKYTFDELLEKGYLPVSCDVLVDPNAAPKKVWIKDSVTDYSFDNILEGVFSSNQPMSFVNIRITNDRGDEVGDQTCFYIRQSETDEFKFPMSQFITEPAFDKLGELNLQNLTPGTYHCTHTMTDLLGKKHIMRDFDFIIK